MRREELGYIIPDPQIKPGVKNPLIPLAHHICDIRPSKVICMGDLYDFPSLSKYDKGKKSHRARTYLKDVTVGNDYQDEFFSIIKSKWPQYKKKSEFVMLLGNHEHRRDRALEYGPDELIDLIEQFPPKYDGWSRVIPFLKIHKWKGIEFSHYFSNQGNGKAISSAAHLLTKRHVSCIAGHKQGFDAAEMISGGGKRIQAMIAGSCYFHNESYMGHNNHHWRGSVVLRNIQNGMFDYDRYDLKYLERKYS